MSVRMLAVVFVVALLGLTQQGDAGTIRHDVDDQAYLDLAAYFPSVGQVQGSSAAGGYFGSATLIDSHWAVTAAHVVDAATSLSFELGGIDYQASNWITHPTWDGQIDKGYDIGLIQFGTDLAAATGIVPASRYTGSDELGRRGTFVGYGATGTGLTGATSFAGDGQRRRAGHNQIDAALRTSGKGDRILLADFDNPATIPSDGNNTGSADPLGLEYLIAGGDSGGGLFLDSDGDDLADVLAGVHSFGWGRLDGTADSDYDDASGSTRLSSFNDWIDSIIGAGTGDGGSGDGGGKGQPAWAGGGKKSKTTAVPEPGALVLLGGGALAVLARRRRAVCG